MSETEEEEAPAGLSDWLDMHQALAWAAFRNEEFAVNADADSMMAERLWPTMRAMTVRSEFALALQDGRLSAQGARPEGDWETIPAAQWQKLAIAPRDASRLAPYEMVRVARRDLLAAFPPIAPKRASFSDNVAWCEDLIAEGSITGMDKAWPMFRLEPEHKGISRENFRLAWNEAKGRKAR